MSCNSSRSTVENPKGFGDTSVNVLAIDSEEQKSKETSTNPSVHQQEGEIDLSTSDALESRLRDSAKFTARDKTKLQAFADVCDDVDNQMTTLSGLACLNYPNAIKPIVDNLPSFLRFKWEKEVVKYAEENNDLYPTFHQFSVMIQKQARAEDINDDKEFGVDNKNERFCSFHERKGHELGECKDFSKKTLEERTDWIKKAGLCFRCLVGKHRAKQCREARKRGERLGGLSCSKILLVDAYAEDRPENAHRVYALMDDQSNASMISPELADLLDIDSPKQKYLLTTCSGAKETKYSWRESGLFVKSMCGRIAKLPNLVECEHKALPPPRGSKEIPPLDQEAKVGILIGRDVPELLKVRAFRNGPKGAPWAQKLAPRMDGVWSNVSGQSWRTIKDEIKEQSEKTKSDVYRTTPEDNEIGLSWEDRQFLHIMEKEIHKNESGNWEMPLPFRSLNVMMPNNQEQAMSRLQSLLRTFERKPQMEKDYLEFLGKLVRLKNMTSGENYAEKIYGVKHRYKVTRESVGKALPHVYLKSLGKQCKDTKPASRPSIPEVVTKNGVASTKKVSHQDVVEVEKFNGMSDKKNSLVETVVINEDNVSDEALSLQVVNKEIIASDSVIMQEVIEKVSIDNNVLSVPGGKRKYSNESEIESPSRVRRQVDDLIDKVENLQKRLNTSQKKTKRRDKKNQFFWSSKGTYEEVGTNDDSLPEATDALVFMAVSVNSGWKVPCRYFLVKDLTGEEKANLTKECITKLHEVGVKVVSFMCDGPTSHQAMLKLFGAQLSPGNLQVSFQHPCDPTAKIYIFLDACHMIKLVRNNMLDWKVLKDKDGNAIKWQFVEELHKLQESEGLHLANKLRSAHIKWKPQKMKVNLAAQALSSSVADALEYCEAEDLVNAANPVLKYLLTYKMSQDHLELFFSAVRACGGWNNNPTTRQFVAAYKQLLMRHYYEILNSVQDQQEINSVSTGISDVAIARRYDLEVRQPAADDHNCCDVSNAMELSEYKEVAISYIAGYVVKMVEKKIHCPQCLAALTTSKENIPDIFVTWKMNGGLN
ncbi:Hypothetical predicted protein [Paramuricea clavata]|uniref:Uncharacterized protein n=1 Tax=Paramuricea clavata TaxID=317549 RepID=A0A6S7GL33_PARCT|nr:Hypothetical predicted protein [Paramuricea clavata]